MVNNVEISKKKGDDMKKENPHINVNPLETRKIPNLLSYELYMGGCLFYL